MQQQVRKNINFFYVLLISNSTRLKPRLKGAFDPRLSENAVLRALVLWDSFYGKIIVLFDIIRIFRGEINWTMDFCNNFYDFLIAFDCRDTSLYDINWFWQLFTCACIQQVESRPFLVVAHWSVMPYVTFFCYSRVWRSICDSLEFLTSICVATSFVVVVGL